MSGASLSVARDGDVVRLDGELVFATATRALGQARQALAAGATRLDLAGVRRSDSAGLACVLALIAGAPRTVKIENLPEAMRALARASEVERLLV